MATKLLIVDDELPLLRNLSRYLASSGNGFDIRTATSAEEALELLQQKPVDILLTDVRLPGLGGIELVQRATALHPGLRVVVMTAYPTRYVRDDALSAGAIHFMEKPLDLKELQALLTEMASAPSGWSGSVGGLDIFDFTQLFVLSGKTSIVEVAYGGQKGVLVFDQGRLVHASCGELGGEDAFYFMTSWSGGTFRELPSEVLPRYASNITTTTSNLMMEAARLMDEAKKPGKEDTRSTGKRRPGPTAGPGGESANGPEVQKRQKEERVMAIKDHLQEFNGIEGFRAVAVFSAQGDMLESETVGKYDIKAAGMFANNALLNAQKATDQMGVGIGNLVQIRAPKATVLMRCLNEATDFAASKEGKAHFHTIVVMDPEGNTGMASMILDKVVAKIAEELR